MARLSMTGSGFQQNPPCHINPLTKRFMEVALCGTPITAAVVKAQPGGNKALDLRFPVMLYEII